MISGIRTSPMWRSSSANLLCVLVTLGSDYPHWRFRDFTQYNQRVVCTMLQTTSRTPPSRSFSVHHSLITKFYDFYTELLKTSLNKCGFRSLETDGVPFDENFLTFRQIIMHWISLSSSPSILEPICVEDEAITILRKVGNCLPKNTASIPWSPESSATAL